MMAFLILHWLKMKDENGSLQMTVVQKAQLHVAQLRREASKQRINVSDAIMDMKVGRCRMLTAAITSPLSLQEFVLQAEPDDCLLTGFNSHRPNPFREKSSCILL